MDQSNKTSETDVDRIEDRTATTGDRKLQELSYEDSNTSNTHHQTKEAKAATAVEHDLTVRDALRLYPKAIAFSLIFSTAVIMEGYDLNLIGSFFGFPPFEDRYGTPDPEGGNQITAPWQSGINNGVQVGSIIGLWLNGIIADRFGYRKTMFGALILMIAFIFIPFFAQNIQTILVGQILCGIPWGAFQTVTVTYASDVAPTVLRPYLTTYVNLCWVIGQFIAAGVLRGFLSRGDQWAYRIPFAIQWVWPPFILLGVVLAPESPWWLVRHNKMDEARKALLSLTSRDTGIPFDVDKHVAMIKATDDRERAVTAGIGYKDLFRRADLRRTEITCMTWVTQAFSGASLMAYSVQFYQRAGLSPEDALNFNLGQYALGFVGTLGSWWLMSYFGRRTLYVYGLGALCGILIITGIMGTLSGNGAALGAGTMLMLYTFVYDFTVGPVCFSLVSEIPSTRLKIKTVALARNCYNIAGIINNILIPRMLLNTEWNWGAKSGFFWAGACFLLLIYHFFRLPEPKDRTYGEMDLMFERNITARNFAKTQVDQLEAEQPETVGHAK